MIDEIGDFLEWGGGAVGGDHRVGCCGFAGRGFDAHGCFLLGLPSSQFRACCGFGLRLLRPGRFPGGCRFSLLRHLRDRLRRGNLIWVCGLSGGTLEDTPPSDEVIQPLAQVYLLGRGPGPLSFRSARLSCGGAFSAMLGRLLSKGRLRLFPLNTATVFRRIVSPAAIALGCSRGVEHPPERW